MSWHTIGTQYLLEFRRNCLGTDGSKVANHDQACLMIITVGLNPLAASTSSIDTALIRIELAVRISEGDGKHPSSCQS